MKLLLVNRESSPTYIHEMENEGFLVEKTAGLAQSHEKCCIYYYDVIILDLGIPGKGAENMLSQLKKSTPHTGIIIISDPVHVQTKIEMLMAGADDYLVRPFEALELSARIKTLIRRCSMRGEQELMHNDVCIDPSSRRVSCCGKPVILTRKEYELLFFFMRNTDKILTHEAIAEYLWGDLKSLSADCFDFIYCHIKNIRKKLAGAGARPFIDTVYGVGYVVR